MTSETLRQPASFRDPNGFLFRRSGVLYRQVNASYEPHYRALMEGGLYQQLAEAGLLIPHQEASAAPVEPDQSFTVIQPEPIQFISYPYEWSFTQLKDAALATLAIQEAAMKVGMTLKDASAYNIQFHRGRPVLIDTLSFEERITGQPWVAYRQFCQHFLAPLALMAYRDVRLAELLRIYIDGVPLDLAADLLPRRTMLNLGLLFHVHLHASAQKRYAGRSVDETSQGQAMGDRSLEGLVDNLKNTISKLRWRAAGSWADYYQFHSYDQEAFGDKQNLVARFLEQVAPDRVLDLGANQGVFSRLATERGMFTVSADIDPGAVQRNYLKMKEEGNDRLLPLLVDLTNPSPGLGWAHQERDSFLARSQFDLTMALALVHHLAISNNVPLPNLAEFFSRLSSWLIIEFIPKSDGQVQKLLASRQDIFSDYSKEGFERAFSEHFHIRESQSITGMGRLIYLMERKSG